MGSRKYVGAACAAAIFFATPAFSLDFEQLKPKLYVGGTLGGVVNNTDGDEVAARMEAKGHTNVSASLDRVAPGFELTAGYQLSNTVSLEASYINWGEFNLDIAGDTRPGASAAEFTRDAMLAAPQSIAGLSVSTIVRGRVTDKVKAIIELGMTRWEYRLEDNATGARIDDSGYSLTVGAGAGYMISDQLEGTATLTLNESDVLLPYISAGLTYYLD